MASWLCADAKEFGGGYGNVPYFYCDGYLDILICQNELTCTQNEYILCIGKYILN